MNEEIAIARRSARGRAGPGERPDAAALARRFRQWLEPVWQSPALTALVIGAGLFLNGFDGAVGQILSCLGNSLLLVALILSRPPSMRFWRRTASVLLLAGGAMLWLVIVRFSAVWMPGDSGVPLAPDMFLPKFLSILSGLAALVIGARAGWRGRRRQELIDALLIVIGIHLIFAVILRALPHGGVWDSWALVRDHRFAGLIGNPNVTAAVCGAAAILALASALDMIGRRAGGERRHSDGARGMFYGGIVLLSLACQLLTAARFPVLMTLGLMAAMLLGERHGIRRRARQFVPALATAGTIVVATLLLYSDLWLERLANLGGEAGMRMQLWSQFAGAAWQSPILGYGAGSFSALNEHILSDNVGAPATWTVNSAHNLLLQLLLNGGLPYAALMILAGGRLARDINQRWPWRAWSALQRGLVFAVILFLACAMVDIVLDFPATACLMLFLAGMAWGQALSRQPALMQLEQAPAQKNALIGRRAARKVK
ncbi:O-antigen ligase family protein [Sphingobium aquiterrae]|uniref:O-antigen ligase family protein n=1 Tax=Sphingobium aquiterrae TaxID=2038656 RepID=UPI0030184D36